MPTRNKSQSHPIEFQRIYDGVRYTRDVYDYQESSEWTNSLRDPSGQLVLRSNPCNLLTMTNVRYKHVGRMGRNGNGPQAVATSYGAMLSGKPHPFGGVGNWRPVDLTNRAYGRFWGKVRKDSASLGVSLAGYAQSRDMMLNRAKQFARLLLDQIRSYKSSHRRLKRARKALERNRKRTPGYEDRANDYLEAKFGWAPLIEDFVAATRLFWTPPPSKRFTATATVKTYQQMPRPSSYNASTFGYRASWAITARCSYSSLVKVTNEALWLANKAGLINPLTIAWDLVPWSWVVNMFVNVNQRLQHATNDVGISLSDTNVTLTHREFSETSIWYLDGNGYVHDNNLYTKKVRTLSTLSPSWSFRAPELDASLVTTATALVLQRARKLQKLFN